MATNQTKKLPNFRFEIQGDAEFKKSIQDRMQTVKNVLTAARNKPATNGVIMNELLTFWIENHDDTAMNDRENVFPPSYVQTKKKDTDQQIFVAAESSISNLCQLSAAQSKLCNGKLTVLKKTMKGHVISIRFQCNIDKSHGYLWSSSPYLPNNEYLVNHRVNHGYLCSGMLPSHYARFSDGAGIGCIKKQRRKFFFQNYKEVAEQVYKDSTQDALYAEIGTYEELDGINIVTDARHGWRKNAKDTSVVAIGENSHKVIDCVHVTKAQDPVSQRHEKFGTVKIYDHLAEQDVSIKVHSHDRNLSINKFVKDTRETTNQNDLWHAVKSLKKSINNISAGTKKSEGWTWSEQLIDKTEPIATHVHWAIRHYEEDPVKLREYMDNIIPHYENNHSKCHPASRCKMDPNYEPSRIVLTSKHAKKLLDKTIKECVIYKYPQDYVLGKDTFYVESFNNVMNIFQDKRISFGDDQYRFRSNLAVCHWNENVDREFTSVHRPNNPNAPRNAKGKKVYKKQTFTYRSTIWKQFIETIY